MVVFEDAVDDAGEVLQLGSTRRSLSPVAGRHRVGQHLAHRVPVQAEHPGGFPNAHAFHHACPRHLNVHLHWIHPSHPPKADNQPYRRRRAVQFSLDFDTTNLGHTAGHAPAPASRCIGILRGRPTNCLEITLCRRITWARRDGKMRVRRFQHLQVRSYAAPSWWRVTVRAGSRPPHDAKCALVWRTPRKASSVGQPGNRRSMAAVRPISSIRARSRARRNTA